MRVVPEAAIGLCFPLKWLLLLASEVVAAVAWHRHMRHAAAM
jgi:hypothetical protein